MSGHDRRLVVRESAGEVDVLRLADAPRHNALSLVMVRQLRAALAEPSTAGAAAMLAEGPHFCAGGDHDELAALDREGFREYVEDVVGLFADVGHAAVPVVCGVQGAAVGGGVEL